MLEDMILANKTIERAYIWEHQAILQTGDSSCEKTY